MKTIGQKLRFEQIERNWRLPVSKFWAEELKQFYDHQRKSPKTFTTLYITANNCRHSSRARGAHFERLHRSYGRVLWCHCSVRDASCSFLTPYVSWHCWCFKKSTIKAAHDAANKRNSSTTLSTFVNRIKNSKLIQTELIVKAAIEKMIIVTELD